MPLLQIKITELDEDPTIPQDFFDDDATSDDSSANSSYEEQNAVSSLGTLIQFKKGLNEDRDGNDNTSTCSSSHIKSKSSKDVKSIGRNRFRSVSSVSTTDAMKLSCISNYFSISVRELNEADWKCVKIVCLQDDSAKGIRCVPLSNIKSKSDTTLHDDKTNIYNTKTYLEVENDDSVSSYYYNEDGDIVIETPQENRPITSYSSSDMFFGEIELEDEEQF
jgi:hypothetical protein